MAKQNIAKNKGSDGEKELDESNIGGDADENIAKEDIIQFIEDIIMDNIFADKSIMHGEKDKEMKSAASKLRILFDLIYEVNDESIIDMAYSWLQFWFEIQKDRKVLSTEVYPYLQYMGNTGGKSMGEYNSTFEDIKNNYARVIDGENKIKMAKHWEKQIENDQV